MTVLTGEAAYINRVKLAGDSGLIFAVGADDHEGSMPYATPPIPLDSNSPLYKAEPSVTPAVGKPA